jgi:hypothetical protein
MPSHDRVQPAVGRCHDCQARIIYSPDPDSPWEFHWKCHKGHAGTISWAHKDPPPRFVAPMDRGLVYEDVPHER